MSCFILNMSFDMLLQQETLYFGCIQSWIVHAISGNKEHLAWQTKVQVRIGALAPIPSGQGLVTAVFDEYFYKCLFLFQFLMSLIDLELFLPCRTVYLSKFMNSL